MADLNIVILIGRFTADPLLRKTPQNQSVMNGTIAVNRTYGKEEKTDFINIVAWNALADNTAKHMRKGSQVGIVGNIHMKKYDDKNGITRTTYEVEANRIVFLTPKGDADQDEWHEESVTLDSADDLPF